MPDVCPHLIQVDVKKFHCKLKQYPLQRCDYSNDGEHWNQCKRLANQWQHRYG